MALDGIILSKICEDLKNYLPMRINKIIGVSDNEIVFNVLAKSKRTNLIISCHSLYNRICLSDRTYNTYNNPSGFIMLMRKHINGGIIYNIEQLSLDRLLILSIVAQDELYDKKEYRLYVELMGKYANIVLVDHSIGKIVDALKRIPPYENTKRIIHPGAIYKLPEKQNKLNPFLTDEANIEESFVKQFEGFSKLLENEVRYRLKDQTFKEIMQEINASNKFYLSFLDSSIEYHVIPLTHLKVKSEECDIHQAFDIIYYDLEEKERIKKSTDNIIKFVKKQSKHFENKIAKLNESYLESLNPEEYKDKGDILYTYGNLNDKGLTEVKLTDFEGRGILISLDPKKTIKENANKYYQNYHKKKKGQEYIKEQLLIAQNEKEYFDSLLEQLDIANVEDSFVITQELIKYGYLKASNKHNYKRNNEKVKVYQIKYKDYLISFGKNHIQNNYVTFKYAKPDYLWFHAQGYHGSHLVINASSVDEETMRFCANLAAYYSKGRYSSSVPVDYCLCKDVKKIKGAKSGLVAISNQKTIYIDPEYPSDLNISFI